MTARYDEVLAGLRAAYDMDAAQRDGQDRQRWKLEERAAFLDFVTAAGAGSLLEVGAGPGHDSAFFQDHGLRVFAVDVSPEMVRRCRDKGLDAEVRDVLRLDLPAGSFDAVYSLNCLLHVPEAQLGDALRAVRTVLRPGGLFFLGLWGGRQYEGVLAGDRLVPPRFFSLRTDAQVLRSVAAHFDVLDFHRVVDGDLHFQSLTLVRPLDD